MSSEADYLINRHAGCGSGCGHDHEETHAHGDEVEHSLHKGAKLSQPHRNFD